MTKTICPSCADWKNETRGRIACFTLGDGVTHYAPDMWLAGRSSRIVGGAVEAHLEALHAWAEQCDLHARYEAQRAARKAHKGRSISTLSPVAQTLMAKHEARMNGVV